MDANAVVAVQPVRRATMQVGAAVVGHLYLVLHTGQLPASCPPAARKMAAGRRRA